MKRLPSLISLLGVAAVSLLGLASCGNDGATCGNGTIDQEGVCVPADTVTCGDGTVLQDGMCVAEATCGTGTVEDPATNTCVPDGSVVCPQGTTFENGQCLLDEDACGEGTVLVNGACVPDDDTLTADLEEAAEPNDGSATPAGMITLGAVDSSTVIHGCVSPRVDADMDGNLDPDFDLWFVTTTSAATVEITADGVGGLVAGFVVVNGDPLLATTLANWRRFGINLTSDTAQRQVYLPAAGTYALQMTDARSLTLAGSGAGSPEACYYTTVKRVATPAPVALTLPLTNGTDNGQVKLYTFNPATQGRILDTTISTATRAMYPAFVVLRGAQNNLYAAVRGTGTTAMNPVNAGFYTVGGLEMAETVTIVVDMEYNWALSPAPYRLDMFDLTGQQLPASGMVTLTKRNGATPADPFADLNYLYFDVPANGALVNFTVTGNNGAMPPVEVRLDMVITRRDIFTAAGAFDTIAVIDAFGSPGRLGGFANQFVRFLQAGRYYLIVQDPTGISGSTYVVNSTFTVTPTTAVTVGTPTAVTPLPANGNGFHTLDLTNPIWLQFGVTATDFPAGAATARLTFYDLNAPSGQGWLRTGTSTTEGNYLQAFRADQAAAGTSPFGRVMARDTRDFLVRVEPIGTPLAAPTYVLDIKNREHHNFQTIVAGMPIMRTGMDDVPAAVGTVFGVKRFIVFGTAGNSLAAAVTPLNAMADIEIRRVDAAEATIGTPVNAGAVGGAETLSTAFAMAPADWVAFEVRNRTPAVTTNLTLALTSTMPRPYTIANGNTAWADACMGGTSFGGAFDDETVALRALPMGWNFQLFGEAVTHYIVSANGTVRFGASSMVDGCAGTCYINDPIPTALAPNGIVAPFWNDLEAMTICVKEEAAKVTIQWVGNEYVAGTGVGATVAFQAIFNMNGTINYVWNAGAAHAATGAAATIGLENLGGTFGHQISHNTAINLAGTSRNLTPM